MLTQARLKELFEYDPGTGHFTRKKSLKGGAKAGERAGVVDKAAGYVQIGVDGGKYRAHRLAFLYMEGRWPSADMDHIGHPGCDWYENRSDNRWCNLRDVSRTKNLQNPHRLSAHNTSGHRGVCFDSSRNKWMAHITVDNKLKALGRFASIDDAIAARAGAEKELS